MLTVGIKDVNTQFMIHTMNVNTIHLQFMIYIIGVDLQPW